MKIILVPNCKSCPHSAMWELDGKQYMCSLLRKVNKTGDKTTLDSCPLRDALSVIKALKGE